MAESQKRSGQGFLIKGLLIACGAAAVFALGFHTARSSSPPPTPEPAVEDAGEAIRQNGYAFINPLLECEIAEGRINTQLEPFKESVENIIQSKIRNREITEAAVYFRDMNNGPWFGINEKDEFLPASLLKLPLALSLYKLAESRPEILQERVVLKQKYDFPGFVQTYPPSQEIEAGKDYSIEELLRASLIYSDNQATELLLLVAIPQLQQKGFMGNAPISLNNDLAYLDSIMSAEKEKLSVRDYSRFFRILFNASFLNRDYSEQVLTLLNGVEFKQGLRAGVPSNIIVAHKFGESGTVGAEYQLHDCGIIYYPNHPYLLCIMSRGENPDELPLAIKEISEEAYNQVKKQFP
ncbi:MAG: serine hydrolase [Patescibacteria group bacterium]|jgi:beta-lactamase class A